MTFHPEFFATGATVIPVLFLAVGVQARDSETLLARGVYERNIYTILLLVIAYLGVLFGGFAECGALWELLERHDGSGWRRIVSLAIVWLLVVFLYSPFFGFVRNVHGRPKENPTTDTHGPVA